MTPEIEAIKHIGNIVNGELVCRSDCPSITHMKKPSEIFNNPEATGFSRVKPNTLDEILKEVEELAYLADIVVFPANEINTAFIQSVKKLRPMLETFLEERTESNNK
jgi:hypothetical protein